MRIDRIKLATELVRREWRDNRLVEMSGVSRATISAVKGGKTISHNTANKIAKALNVDPAEIIEQEGC